jgi:hypothetical protein
VSSDLPWAFRMVRVQVNRPSTVDRSSACRCARAPVAWLALDWGTRDRASHLSRSARACARKQHPSLHPSAVPPPFPSLHCPGNVCSPPLVAMEPPAKRLRILRSLEVDETNPDYVHAKQKQQQKFKGRLESIFAKYENMHESMSDEINMLDDDGAIVVDRGHMRRLARQVDRKETLLLDSLGMGNGGPAEDASEDEEDCEDSEDELAPTQLPKTSSAQKEQNKQKNSIGDGAQSSPSNNIQHTSQSLQPVPTALTQTAEQVAPQTPNPAANLLQFVQFPQTPAGQQAQTSFYATLAQTINHAVQQAVAPLFSSILPNTPAVQLPLPTALPLSAAPATVTDEIAPARDPKWFFPPLSKESRESQVARSSPLASNKRLSLQPEMEQEKGHEIRPKRKLKAKSKSARLQGPVSVAAPVQSEEKASKKPKKATHRKSPRVEIQHTPVRRATYRFTEDDDIYVAKKRELHGYTWSQIRDSKNKWSDWPLSTFQRRWAKHLAGRDLHLRDLSGHGDISGERTAALLPHHLPTPSSSEQEDNTPVADAVASINENTMSSSTHYDADDCDLLSLPGADLDEEHLPLESEEEETFFPDDDEMVLPSIELTAFIDEDALQQGLLEGSPMEANEETTHTIKTEPTVSSPPSKRKQTRAYLKHQDLPESVTEADNREPFSREGSLQDDQDHQDSQGSIHDKHRSISASIDLVGDDELQAAAPTTPYIKREFSTPPPTSFLFSTPAAQPDVSSSGVKPASALSRKAYLKQVKQSWTKKSTPAPKTVTKRRSFHTVPMKRAWVDDAASDDELGF